MQFIRPSLSRSALGAGALFFVTLSQAHAQAANPCGGTAALVTNPGAGLASLNVALAVDFFATSATPLVTTAPNGKAGEPRIGVWGRGVGGQSTTTTNTAISAPAIGCRSRVQTSYAGFQTGLDYGVSDIGGTDWNGHFGLTVGSAWAEPSLTAGSGTLNYSVPFLGVYSVMMNGNFFSHVQIRHGWHTVDINNSALGLIGSELSASSWDFSGSAGYRFNLNDGQGPLGPLFIEPSLGLNVSTTAVGALNVPLSPLSPSGVVAINPVVGVLGMGGLRFGTSFTSSDNKVTYQPYALANVWHEFSDNITAEFIPTALPFNRTGVSMSRVGTFGQFGGGLAAQTSEGLLGYIRADYRTGERTEGWAIAAGGRYAF